jgi:hypothetical protein
MVSWVFAVEFTFFGHVCINLNEYPIIYTNIIGSTRKICGDLFFNVYIECGKTGIFGISVGSLDPHALGPTSTTFVMIIVIIFSVFNDL